MQAQSLVCSEYSTCVSIRQPFSPLPGWFYGPTAPPWVELDLTMSGQTSALLARAHPSPRDRGSGNRRNRGKLRAVPRIPPARMPTNSAGPGESISPPAHWPGKGSESQCIEGVLCLSLGLTNGLAWSGLCTLADIGAPQELRLSCIPLSAATPCPASTELPSIGPPSPPSLTPSLRLAEIWLVDSTCFSTGLYTQHGLSPLPVF